MWPAHCSWRGETSLTLSRTLVQRVEHADVAVAADAEHVRHLLLDQVLGDQLAALHVDSYGTVVLNGAVHGSRRQ